MTVSSQTIRHLLFPLCFIASGVFHFSRAEFYASRLPAEVPARTEIVLAVGALELVLGALALVARARAFAAIAISCILAGAIAANVFALVTGRQPDDLPVGLQWLRVGMLVALAMWALVTARNARRARIGAREPRHK